MAKTACMFPAESFPASQPARHELLSLCSRNEMIRHTFRILPGIGPRIEYRLWRHGILTWEDFLAAGSIEFLSPHTKALYDARLRTAQRRLAARDGHYFSQCLRRAEQWRLFPDFQDCAVALDIETNGLPACAGGIVTVVGLCDGLDYKPLMRGAGLTPKRLQRELAPYPYLITFYGSAFDLPYMQQTLGVSFTGLHFDLCFGGRRVGLKGGLKRIEQILHLARDESVRGLDGLDAVKLWQAAENGDKAARDVLFTYNRFDTVNLFAIAQTVYQRLRSATGLDMAAAEKGSRTMPSRLRD